MDKLELIERLIEGSHNNEELWFYDPSGTYKDESNGWGVSLDEIYLEWLDKEFISVSGENSHFDLYFTDFGKTWGFLNDNPKLKKIADKERKKAKERASKFYKSLTNSMDKEFKKFKGDGLAEYKPIKKINEESN